MDTYFVWDQWIEFHSWHLCHTVHILHRVRYHGRRSITIYFSPLPLIRDNLARPTDFNHLRLFCFHLNQGRLTVSGQIRGGQAQGEPEQRRYPRASSSSRSNRSKPWPLSGGTALSSISRRWYRTSTTSFSFSYSSAIRNPSSYRSIAFSCILIIDFSCLHW